MKHLIPGALCLLLFSLAPALAEAQSSQSRDEDRRARELYENGVMLYDEGDYENAVFAWKEAYILSPRPLLLYNIANALERIGYWQEALDYLNRYRALAPTEEREVLDRRMRSIERRLRERREEESLEEGRRTKLIEAEQSLRESTRSRSSAQPWQSAGGAPHPAPVVVAGFGLAGLAVGGVLGGLAVTARSDAMALCAPQNDLVLCPTEVASYTAIDASYSLGSDISLIAGGTLAATGLIAAIVEAGTRSQKRRAAFRILPGGSPQGASLTLVGRF